MITYPFPKHSTDPLVTFTSWINTLRPRQNGRNFPDDIFKRTFLNENVLIALEISLKFVPKGPINNIPALVQIMAWRRPGDKSLSEPMMVSLPMHICVTRPQWVILRNNIFLHSLSFHDIEMAQIFEGARASAATSLAKFSWGPDYLKISILKSISDNKDFQTWHLIGWQHSHQPIISHVRKSLSTTVWQT